jgi:predicted ATPase/DNA-binding XRE family transcriptional regulator
VEAKSFGEWLRHRRRELDLTQQELARQVGCAPITVRKIESEQMRPSKQLAELLCEHLGVAAGEMGRFMRFARGAEAIEPVLVEPPRHNLPHPVSTFVGREREIAEIQSLLSTSRLITLTGAGGCGKSRLALEVAHRMFAHVPDGAWLVGFAPISDGALVAPTVGAALKVREEAGRPLIETLSAYLYPRDLLLLLDNCEHLLDECAHLANTLLEACPRLRILATSREALGIQGEERFYVPSLSVPRDEHADSAAGLLRFEAAALFADRAKMAKRDFDLTASNLRPIGKICERLDGMPLAIELAAARVTTLTVGEIAERLDHCLSLLTDGNRAALPRHQTLRATIQWSYDLLLDAERVVFRRLCVFTGGWTLPAAEAVCAGEGIAASEMLDLVSKLVAKSLATAEDRGGEVRYHFLETVRQYGYERLVEQGELERMRDRHLDYFTDWVEELEPNLRGPQQLRCWNRIQEDHDNIRSALDWSLRGGPAERSLRLATAMYWFWQPRGYYAECLKWLTAAYAPVSSLPLTRLRVKALQLTGQSGWETGKAGWEMNATGPVEGWLEKCLEFWRKSDDPWWTAFALFYLGWRRLYQAKPDVAKVAFEDAVVHARASKDNWILANSLKGLGAATQRFDYGAARPILEESIGIWRKVGDQERLADALQQLASVAHAQNDAGWAQALFEESLRLYRQVGNRSGVAMVSCELGVSLESQGSDDKASRVFGEAIAASKEAGTEHSIAWALSGLAGVAASQGDPRRAARLLGAAAAWRKSVGEDLAVWPFSLADHKRWEAAAQAGLRAEAFEAAFAEGWAMTLEDAAKYALQGLSISEPARKQPRAARAGSRRIIRQPARPVSSK